MARSETIRRLWVRREGPSPLQRRGPKLRTASITGRAKRPLQIGTAVLIGLIALSAYGGVVGLVGGGLSFGETIDARLPYGSLFLGGIALLFFVAAPMTLAAVVSLRDLRHAGDIVMGAGLLLVAWIAIELAFIKSYSWFHPTYLALGILVALGGWLLNRADRQTFESTTSRQAEPQNSGQAPTDIRIGAIDAESFVEKSAIVRAPTSHHSPLARVDDRTARVRHRTRRNRQARTSDGAQLESDQGYEHPILVRGQFLHGGRCWIRTNPGSS